MDITKPEVDYPEGKPPTAEAVRQRLFLIRYSLEKLFPGQDSFPCTWTYLTCRR